jgi:hypothetical protein
MKGNQSETAIAVDPLNPMLLASSANDNAIVPGAMFSYSTDGGKTWKSRVLGDGTDGIPKDVTDPFLVWDTFGNLYLSYIDDTLKNAIIVISTDGGKTFKKLTSFTCQDQPKMAFGDGFLWITYNNGDMEAAGAKVTGQGQVGNFGSVLKIPNSTGQNFGGLAVGPKGEVIATFQTASSGGGPDKIMSSLNTGGTAGSFSTPKVVTNVNVGGFRHIPPQPVRSVDSESKVAYDLSNGPHRGRLYMTYTDSSSSADNNGDLQIYERFSDDDGKTWSARIKVNDDNNSLSHFLPALAVDPTTGVLAVEWYDCRNDPNNKNVEDFATASFDGGQTFTGNVQVAGAPSNAIKAGDNNSNDFGDYSAVAFFGGVIHPCWVDNSTSLAGNPDAPNFDIATAAVTVPGTTNGGTGLAQDAFEPNDTSNTAHSLGNLVAPQKFTGLTIATHANGLPDYDWYSWTAGAAGTYTSAINYTTTDGGDLHIRLYTLDANGDLIQIASSRLTGVTTQTVSVPVVRGELLFLWVYGFDNSQGTYSLSASIS